jgi:hypothetical protein
MKYFRFNLKDSNLTKQKNELVWDLPLTINQRLVGLSSVSLELEDHYEPKEDTFCTICCNLLDRSMENQHGILATLRRGEPHYWSFHQMSKTTGTILLQSK